ncbi:hypothetical protein DW654_07830 [Roseburia inulinivorans]|uniref:Uncharacterized protein n=1 Tax=Roseburia inulinivorans TaxID=360807 RepID=A0A3R6DQP5_9FIRM|nr:hypothetical protein DW654_07830 [Roseburia inulinivorans]
MPPPTASIRCSLCLHLQILL